MTTASGKPPIPGSPSRSRTGAIGLAIGGLLIGLGGAMHPRVDTSLEFDQGLVGMFESATWAASHLLTMAGFATLAVSLFVLVRALGQAWTPRLRLIGWIAAGAAGVAALESVPHLLAASEADAVTRGESTPLSDLHTTLQAFTTPAVGLSVAALALVGARGRGLDGGRVATSLAVLGGLAFAFAGPAIAISEDSAFSPLFTGAAGMAIWAVVTGIRTARGAATAKPPIERSYPHTIDNGGGETLTFVARRVDVAGEYLEVRNSVAPGAGPPMHVHHLQEESLTIECGTLGYQTKGGARQTAGPGDTVTFAPGEAHRFWNAGDEALVCTGIVRPPGNLEYFLGEIFASTERHGGRRPGIFDAAYLCHRYRSEFEMLEAPAPVRRLVFPAVAAVGSLFGLHRRFAGAPEPARRPSPRQPITGARVPGGVR